MMRPGADIKITRRKALGVLATGTLACAGGYVLVRRHYPPPPGTTPALPRKLACRYPPGTCPLGPEQRQAIRQKLRLKQGASFGSLLHWLRVFGTGPETPAHGQEVRALLAEIMDAGRLMLRYKSESPLVRTAQGMRYIFSNARSRPPRPERGSHAYQALSVFAELGLPLSHPLIPAEGAGRVSDLFHDCLLNIQLRDVSDMEPEWAAVAIALYLPPTSAWQNRWGERLTLSDLADYLLGRPPEHSSCAGTHLLFDLAALLQVHRQCTVLSRSAASRVEDFMAVMAATAERTQRPTGSWGPEWHGRAALYPDSPSTTLLVTGHLLEGLTYLPPQHQIRPGVANKALAFLARELEAADDTAVAADYCPYSHAARVLLHCPNGEE